MFRAEALPEVVIHEILANPRRRETIRYLTDTAVGRTVSLRDLSASIATHETGQSPPPRAVRESVYNSLHQTHLPKLADLGVIDYDREARAVSLQPNARAVDRYIDVDTICGISWSEYYSTLGVVGLVAVVASLAGVPVVSAVDPLLLASGFLAAFALSLSYQLWSVRWYLRRLFG
jgi:hypothetical protein